MITSDYSIVIMSCDGYSDIWPYFTQCWDKYWADCPFEIFLVSEQKEFQHHKIKNIQTKQPAIWGEMMSYVINKVDSKYIIYLQEDYLLKGSINTKNFIQLLEAFENEQAAYLRLFPWPGPDMELESNHNIGVCSDTSNYRTSLQAAVWDKEVLKELVKKEENGWQFESNSIARSKKIEKPFLSVKVEDCHFENMNSFNHVFNYFATGVFQGKWQKDCLKYFKKQNIKIQPGKRGVLSSWDYKMYQKKKQNKYNGLLRLIDKFVFQSKLFISIHNKVALIHHYLIYNK